MFISIVFFGGQFDNKNILTWAYLVEPKFLVPQNNPYQILPCTCKDIMKEYFDTSVTQNIGNDLNITNRRLFNKLWYVRTMFYLKRIRQF